MLKGIRYEKKTAEKYEIGGIWTKVEKLKVWKIKSKYKIEFEFDFYE
jgi:hypothetical protein